MQTSPIKSSFLLRVLLFLIGFSGVPAFGQLRGGLETFENEANALSWFVYDFTIEDFDDPGWDLLGNGDADIFTIVAPDSGVSFLADGSSSGGDLVGDFSGKRIEGMGCEAFVEDPSGLLYAEFYFISDGVFYFSVEFSTPTFFGSGGWEFIEVDFKIDPWYVLDDQGFDETELTDEILDSVTEVGVSFFANDSRSESMLVAIDDFYLVPEVILPELAVGRKGNDFEISFLRQEGQEYNVMKADDLMGWTGLAGHLGITGDSVYTVSDPFSDRRFFQVETDFIFMVIPDVDSF